VKRPRCRPRIIAGVAELDGKIALLTGASGGLGTAIRACLEREGATVVGIDPAGGDSEPLDASTDEGCRRMVELALERHGRLDILALNAGLQHMAPFAEFPLEQWERLMGLMLTGPFLAIKHAWAPLTERPGGRIVVTASTSSMVGEAFKPAYVSAKHGVAGLVKVAAREGAKLGLTANAVAPGWMWTPMAENQIDDQARLHGRTREDVLATMDDHNPAGRMLEPAEVAEVVAFLSSARASGINGAVIPIDLGAIAAI
jgi:3-hydroxybutyrate dehydrogenase